MAGAATVEKALDVLFHLHDASAALGLSEIGRALDLPKSSCHRLLASLVQREIVEQDEAGRYRPGLALLSLGIGAQNREPAVQAARPILEAEALALGETVFLVGRRRGRLRVLDKVEGTGFLRAAPAVGDVVPDDVTAAGKLYRFLGDATPGIASEVGLDPSARGLEAPGEPADATEPAEASAVRRQGFALNRDAWIQGLCVLGAPIWQSLPSEPPRLVAVLALAAATPRFDALGEARIAERLLAAATAVGGRLG